jgi:hypothetical protein
MNTKEEIKAAARKRFATKEVEIADGVKVTLKEISMAARKALNGRLFVTDDATGLPKDENGSWTYRDGIHVTEEWLAATMDPAHTVDELLTDDWPESLKMELRRQAMKLNGMNVEDAAGKS